MKYRSLLLLILIVLAAVPEAAADDKLTGKVIGTSDCYDYATGRSSKTINTPENAFDGDLSTFVATYDRSRTWVGLDLGTPHVITRVGWSPRNDGTGPSRCVLGIFEGSDDPTFINAVPLYLISSPGVIGEISHADVNVSRGFRYVRYVGPHDARCNIAELEFYGHKGEGDDSHFYQVTNLPTLSYHTTTGYDPTSKSTELEASMVITYDDGARIQEYPILVRCRGNASYGFEKKPYRIKFNDGNTHHMLKGSPLESPAKAKKWTLINNYGDKTLMRNIIAFETSRRLGMEYTVWCQPVDVLVNGEYKGCYQLCDQITADNQRVPVTEMTPEDEDLPEISGGYIVEIDAYAGSERSMFYSNRGMPVTIKEPGEDDITTAQHSYIKSAFDTMEAAVWSNRYTNREQGWRSRLDEETFLRHFLVGEFSGNTDTYWSVYMYKEREDDVFHVGPSWDFDLAFNNDVRTYPVNNHRDWIYRDGGSGASGMTSFVNRIMSDPSAQERLKEIWSEARATNMTGSSLAAYVDSTAKVLDASQRLNFIRWPILGTRVHENAFAYPTYKEEVEVVRRYVIDRIDWIDRKLGEEDPGHDPGGRDDGQMTITSASDLMRFAKAVNGGKNYMNATLTKDIDMAYILTSFPLIGNRELPYCGTFDGGGHVISNFRLNRPNESFVGFFPVIGDGAEICNLTFDSSCSITGNAFTGIVGGTDCSGSITLLGIGMEGDVTTVNQNAGGIIGCNYGSTCAYDIEDCYVTGNIRGGNESAALSGWVGSNATIINCYSAATVSGLDANHTLIRGAAGVINCYDINSDDMGAELLDPARLADGSLCFDLNDGSSDDDVVWRQNLDGSDGHPVLIPSHKKVFWHKDSGIWSNDPTGFVPMQQVDDRQPADKQLSYDLQGRPVSAPAKGIYIRNGRKVLIR